jgi:4-hydroxybenzoate polyprenyltransferase
MSVGWSNDAHDAELDARAGRTDKPTVTGRATTRALWWAAVVAAGACLVASVVVAGVLGGSFHVAFVAAAWAYNLGLSRTAWSWAAYAVAFACLPFFLVVGLDGSWPPAWMVVVLSLVGVSAHLGNALPDLERDGTAGVGGTAVRLGRRRSTVLAWVLLGAATGILALVARDAAPWLAGVVVLAYAAAVVVGLRSRHPQAMFAAVVAVVAVDAIVLVLAA